MVPNHIGRGTRVEEKLLERLFDGIGVGSIPRVYPPTIAFLIMQ
jgi:hypothetical protein